MSVPYWSLTFGIQASTSGSTSDEPAPLSDAFSESPPLEPPHAGRPTASNANAMRETVVRPMDPFGSSTGARTPQSCWPVGRDVATIRLEAGERGLDRGSQDRLASLRFDSRTP